MINLIS